MKLKSMQDVNNALGQYHTAKVSVEKLELDHTKQVEKIELKFFAKIRPFAKTVAVLKTAIETFILANKDRLFNANSKSMTLPSGVIGIHAYKPRLEITDAEKTIFLIRKYFPDRADQAIRTIEEPAKSVLADWSDADLVKIAVKREESVSKPWFETNKVQTAKRANNARK